MLIYSFVTFDIIYMIDSQKKLVFSTPILYTKVLKKPDTFYLLQTRKFQNIKLIRYGYFNIKTLENNLCKNILIKYRT